jgi:hypothetical protein
MRYEGHAVVQYKGRDEEVNITYMGSRAPGLDRSIAKQRLEKYFPRGSQQPAEAKHISRN